MQKLSVKAPNCFHIIYRHYHLTLPSSYNLLSAVTFANSLESDQARQNDGPDLIISQVMIDSGHLMQQLIYNIYSRLNQLGHCYGNLKKITLMILP